MAKKSQLDRLISKKIDKAIFQYNMIEDGDRILVAVSGGKDSMTLMHQLMQKAKGFPRKFEIFAVHIKSDFCNCMKKTRMETVLQEWGANYKILQVPILKRLKPDKKMNCYWCSTQRRTELLKYANENGFNKIAFGHHMDDILETFFMNMTYKGEMSTMLPILKYDKYDQTIIRPLTFVEEHEVIDYAVSKGINKLNCTCPFGKNSNRLDMRKIISTMAKEGGFVRANIFKSMSNVNKDYLPQM